MNTNVLQEAPLYGQSLQACLEKIPERYDNFIQMPQISLKKKIGIPLLKWEGGVVTFGHSLTFFGATAMNPKAAQCV